MHFQTSHDITIAAGPAAGQSGGAADKLLAGRCPYGTVQYILRSTCVFVARSRHALAFCVSMWQLADLSPTRSHSGQQFTASIVKSNKFNREVSSD